MVMRDKYYSLNSPLERGDAIAPGCVLFKSMSKSLKIKSLLFIFVSLLFVGNANLVMAADTPAKAGEYGISETLKVEGLKTSLTGTDVDIKLGQIIGYLLSFIGLIFLILVIYGGFMWMTAGGDAAKVSKAIELFTQASIGLLLISAAYVITKFVGDVVIK